MIRFYRSHTIPPEIRKVILDALVFFIKSTLSSYIIDPQITIAQDFYAAIKS